MEFQFNKVMIKKVNTLINKKLTFSMENKKVQQFNIIQQAKNGKPYTKIINEMVNRKKYSPMVEYKLDIGNKAKQSRTGKINQNE